MVVVCVTASVISHLTLVSRPYRPLLQVRHHSVVDQASSYTSYWIQVWFVSAWVTGKTVWCPSYHGPYIWASLAIGSFHNRALYKVSEYTLHVLISLMHHHHPALLHHHTLIMDRLLTFLMTFYTLVLKLSFSQSLSLHGPNSPRLGLGLGLASDEVFQ